ncbi:MAG: FAD/NAD(P)-binding protein [Sphingobium sp.]
MTTVIDPSIAIIGAGLSGTLLAINLLRYGHGRIILIERRSDRLARGVAFGTDNPQHLLNVRVSNMSAFPDDPGHFARWLGPSASNGLNRFVERRTYGAYVRQLLDEATDAHPGRLQVVAGEAIGASRGTTGWHIMLAEGGTVDADMLVLAQGNFPPASLPAFEQISAAHYFADPWAGGMEEGLTRDDVVLVIGSGLTAVDVVLTMNDKGFQGKIIALSRRGLRPRGHASVGPVADKADRPSLDGSRLVGHVRKRAKDVGWRTAIDELRPHTQDLWRRMDIATRRRFLRHLRPYWDVHRHRLAPTVEHKVDALQMENRLRFVAGKVTSAVENGGGVTVEWRSRRTDIRHRVTVKRIINCTGPVSDLTLCDDPLIADLHRRGYIAPAPLGLGLDVNAGGQLRSADGRVQADLLAVGPMTRGECWEIVAVPDIRQQVWSLARRLCHSHWVEAEGL